MDGRTKSGIEDQCEAEELDAALTLAGYGKFNYTLTFLSALCVLTFGLQSGVSSYVFPAAQSELKLSTYQIGLLNVLFLAGTICSSFLWGVLADIGGRRRILIASLILGFVVTFTSASMNTFGGLALCRTLNGFLSGASGSVTFNYIAEFHEPRRRNKVVCYLGVSFTLAWILLPTACYRILPINSLGLTSWRIVLLLVAAPELLAGVLLCFAPDSPKFLAEKGKVEEALKVVASMHRWNCGTKEEFVVRRLAAGESSKGAKFLEMWTDVRRLFGQPLLFTTLLICGIMFCNMFGYFGLGLWLPELFNRFQQFERRFPNETVTVKHLASLKNVQSTSFNFDWALFQNTLYVGASSLLGNLLSGWISGKVPRSTVPLVTMFVGAASSGSIYFLTSSTQNLVVSCIFQSAMATGNIAIGGVVVEYFPTSVAAMAMCLATACGRLGSMLSNVTFSFLMDTRCEVPVVLVSCTLLLGGMLCFFIPKGSSRTSSFEYFAREKLEIAVISNGKVDT